MKREIREVDAERGIVQITTADERWYARLVNQGTEWDFVPSVTWITGFYPKGVGFFKWLASHGWDEAEEIKALAGDKGSKVHQAISVLLAGGTVGEKDSFENPRTLQKEELTEDEVFCLVTFQQWFEEVQPEVIANEYTVWNEYWRYAGTVDLLCRIRTKGRHGREIITTWVIDFKTSSQVWPAHELQVCAYKHADKSLPKGTKLGILQLGYKKNKFKKWKFTPVSDQFRLFMAVRKIWKKETEGIKPFQRELPLSITLNRKERTINA